MYHYGIYLTFSWCRLIDYYWFYYYYDHSDDDDDDDQWLLVTIHREEVNNKYQVVAISCYKIEV